MVDVNCVEFLNKSDIEGLHEMKAKYDLLFIENFNETLFDKKTLIK